MTTHAESAALPAVPEPPPGRRWDCLLVVGMIAALGVSGVQLVRLGWPRLQPEFKPSVAFLLPQRRTLDSLADEWEIPAWPPLAPVDLRGAVSTVELRGAEPAPRNPAPGVGATDDRAARWRIRFDADLTPLEYGQRLDALGIELGVPAGGGKIDYVSALAVAAPQRRQGAVAEENRLYLSWSAGGLPQADAEFLAKAGLVQQDVVLHFLPIALEEQMAGLETAFASAEVAAIVETEFGIRPRAAGGFEMYVIAQRVRGQTPPVGN